MKQLTADPAHDIGLRDVDGDPRSLRTAFSYFPSGVTAVCAIVDDVPVGLAASSFSTVSLDPPLVSVCMQTTSSTWPKLREASRLGISVLAEDQDALCQQLSRKTGDRFNGLDWSQNAEGAVLIDGAALWLSCSIAEEVSAGDHSIVLFEIHALHAAPQVEPLIFHASSFRRLVARELAADVAS